MNGRIRYAGLRRLLLLAVGASLLAACARPRVAEVYPEVERFAGRQIDEVAYVNIAPFTEDSIRAVTQLRETRCELVPFIFPFCVPGTWWGLRLRVVDLEHLGRDLSRLTALYRQSGFFGTIVVPEIEELAPSPGPVRVTYRVERGPEIFLDTLVVEGTEGILDPDVLTRGLRLQPGDRFELPEFLAASDEIAARLRAEGYAQAEILRNYTVDATRQIATATLVAIPGPRVVIDGILMQGLDVLDARTIRRQITVNEGDLLLQSRVRESQRNLFELELIQFASVAVAPDTLQLAPDDPETATILVQVTEADEYLVEMLAGFGTQDCLRTAAQWVDRSFIRGARRLAVTASASRIATGICEPRDTVFGREIDYRVTAELAQPHFITHRNRLAFGVFTERSTQPQLYRRTAQGARLSLTNRLGARETLTGNVDVEYRDTEAVPALYCYAFAVCTPEDIEALGEPRWRNAVGASWVRDRGNRPVSPSRGYSLRSGVVWTSPVIGSDYDFVRTSGDLAVYNQLAPALVLAGRLRLGSFLTRATLEADGFIPPEERFYAGGANSVRGYARNQLGPGVWLLDDTAVPDTVRGDLPVLFFPSGGVSVAAASAELRFPAPGLRRRVGLVAFVDAGMISTDPLWEMSEPWRMTPGAGARVETPVGPVRVDLAYNPNPRPRGPLLVAEGDGLRRIADRYRPDSPPFWRRFQLHIAVGQAF
jgi:outer membrane protein assembly factor BamA